MIWRLEHKADKSGRREIVVGGWNSIQGEMTGIWMWVALMEASPEMRRAKLQ